MKRNCPNCNNAINYKSKYNYFYALEKNTWCKQCVAIKNGSKNRGISISKELKDKISKSLKGVNTWSKGRKLTLEHANKIRMKSCERRKTLGINSNEDTGAKEWFEDANKNLNYNFKTNYYLKDLGYFADGYDLENHIWAEYDSRYHKNDKQREKDRIREYNIIEYFKSKNNPLKSFIRIDAVNENKITTII